MALQYNMQADFFGLVGELVTTDCGHRTGFTHISSDVIKHNPDDSALAGIHTLECLSFDCGHIWKFAQKALPARG